MKQPGVIFLGKQSVHANVIEEHGYRQTPRHQGRKNLLRVLYDKKHTIYLHIYTTKKLGKQTRLYMAHERASKGLRKHPAQTRRSFCIAWSVHALLVKCTLCVSVKSMCVPCRTQTAFGRYADDSLAGRIHALPVITMCHA